MLETFGSSASVRTTLGSVGKTPESLAEPKKALRDTRETLEVVLEILCHVTVALGRLEAGLVTMVYAKIWPVTVLEMLGSARMVRETRGPEKLILKTLGPVKKAFEMLEFVAVISESGRYVTLTLDVLKLCLQQWLFRHFSL